MNMFKKGRWPEEDFVMPPVAPEMTNHLTTVYGVYAVVSVGLTVWLARTLFRNGAVFLRDVFKDKPELAEAVNRLLVRGASR